MNAYELAKNISKDNFVILTDDKKLIANMLRQQADRIAELEKDLHMIQRHYDQLNHDTTPQIKELSDEEIIKLKDEYTKVPSKPWSGIPMAHFDVCGFARAILQNASEK